MFHNYFETRQDKENVLLNNTKNMNILEMYYSRQDELF